MQAYHHGIADLPKACITKRVAALLSHEKLGPLGGPGRMRCWMHPRI